MVHTFSNPLFRRELITEDYQQNEDAKWIRMKKLTYTDPSGKTRQWEMAERQVGTTIHLHHIIILTQTPTRHVPRTPNATASA